MNKKIEKLLQKATKLQNQFEETSKKLEEEIQPLCDFEVGVTFCQGDGVLMIDENSNVGSFSSLEGKSKKNKLTNDEFSSFTL